MATFGESRPRFADLPHVVLDFCPEFIDGLIEVTRTRPGIWALDPPYFPGGKCVYELADPEDLDPDLTRFGEWCIPANRENIRKEIRSGSVGEFGLNDRILVDCGIDVGILWRLLPIQTLSVPVVIDRIVEAKGELRWIGVPYLRGLDCIAFVFERAYAHWAEALRTWASAKGVKWAKVVIIGDEVQLSGFLAEIKVNRDTRS